MSRENPINETNLTFKDSLDLKEPPLYKVIMHNDHYTTMDFVIEMLVTVFHKPAAEATTIMLDVHKKGAGMCGIYTRDIAQTKVEEVHTHAREHSFPLRCSIEPA